MGRIIRTGKIVTGLVATLGFATALYSVAKTNCYNQSAKEINQNSDEEIKIGLIGLTTGIISGFLYLGFYQEEYNRKNEKNKNYHNNP